LSIGVDGAVRPAGAAIGDVVTGCPVCGTARAVRGPEGRTCVAACTVFGAGGSVSASASRTGGEGSAVKKSACLFSLAGGDESVDADFERSSEPRRVAEGAAWFPDWSLREGFWMENSWDKDSDFAVSGGRT
jgi:hypothetical protein